MYSSEAKREEGSEQTLAAIRRTRLRRIAAAVVLFEAASMTFRASAAGLRGLSGHSVGLVGHSYPAGHLGGIQPPGAYAHSPAQYGNLGSARGGWYHRSFGGTSNPGWDYGFGPRLGGTGH